MPQLGQGLSLGDPGQTPGPLWARFVHMEKGAPQTWSAELRHVHGVRRVGTPQWSKRMLTQE